MGISEAGLALAAEVATTIAAFDGPRTGRTEVRLPSHRVLIVFWGDDAYDRGIVEFEAVCRDDSQPLPCCALDLHEATGSWFYLL